MLMQEIFVQSWLLYSGPVQNMFSSLNESPPPAQATWPDGGWARASQNITSMVMIIVNATYTGRQLSRQPDKVIGVLEKKQNYQHLALYVSADESGRMGEGV